jgi:hypothetical protein
MKRERAGHIPGKQRRPAAERTGGPVARGNTAPPERPNDSILTDVVRRRLALATREPNVRAVSRALCRGWGDDPDELIPICDRAGKDTGKSAEKWTLFRREAVAAITAFVIAEGESGEPVDIPSFLSAFRRDRAG